MVKIQDGPIQIRHNICRIKLYKSDANVKYINPKNVCDDVNISSPVIYFYILLMLGHKVYNQDTYKDHDVN